jgi:hypothetical protein
MPQGLTSAFPGVSLWHGGIYDGSVTAVDEPYRRQKNKPFVEPLFHRFIRRWHVDFSDRL